MDMDNRGDRDFHPPVRTGTSPVGVLYDGDAMFEDDTACIIPECLCHAWFCTYFLSAARTAMKAFCGIWTWPTCFIFALPFFCFSRSFFLRVTSPP